MSLDVTKIVAATGAALSPIGTTLGDTWSALVGDRVAAWRVKNAAALQEAVQAEIAARGLKLDRSKVPERYALTWFEEATKQDEPEIQTLFARLLVGAAGGCPDATDRRHLEMLTRFTPLDAQCFQWFFVTMAKVPGGHPSSPEFEAWKKLRAEMDEAAWMSIEHLLALGVLERRFDVVRAEQSPYSEELTAFAEISATDRGLSLFRAFTSPPLV